MVCHTKELTFHGQTRAGKLSNEQIMQALRQAENGTPVMELAESWGLPKRPSTAGRSVSRDSMSARSVSSGSFVTRIVI